MLIQWLDLDSVELVWQESATERLGHFFGADFFVASKIQRKRPGVSFVGVSWIRSVVVMFFVKTPRHRWLVQANMQFPGHEYFTVTWRQGFDESCCEGSEIMKGFELKRETLTGKKAWELDKIDDSFRINSVIWTCSTSLDCSILYLLDCWIDSCSTGNCFPLCLQLLLERPRRRLLATLNRGQGSYADYMKVGLFPTAVFFCFGFLNLDGWSGGDAHPRCCLKPRLASCVWSCFL